jgi:4-hydroxy-tetrahydrodipicolinate synthase
MAKYGRDEAKAVAKERIRGVFSAITMPLTDAGEIDEAGLRHNVRHCIDVIGVGGLYIHGFYGEFWLLTTDERRRALEIVIDEAKGAIPVVARCAHQTMRETISLIQHAEAAGADFISLIGPAFGNGSSDMIYDYFERLGKETDLGFSVFNTAQVGYVMPPELFARLAEIPNVVALKNEVSLEHTLKVRSLVGDQLQVVDPSEETFLMSMLQFGQQAIYTGTNYMYDNAAAQPMKDYVDAALSGDAATAAQRYYAMQPLRDLHNKWVLQPWKRDARCPVSTVKWWTELAGMKAGPVREPLPTLAEDDKNRMAEELEAAGYAVQSR